MMRSLFSGVAGLKTHQTKMDVIGNNIANVNTVGFKGSNVNFADTFYQTVSGASGPSAVSGAAGTNAKQIGLGSSVASITTNITEAGGTSTTGRALDVAIVGDSFLVVKSGGATYFTKSGALNVDEAGTLYCTTNGATVQGWMADSKGEVKTDTVQDIKVMTPEQMYIEPTATSNITLKGNLDKDDKQLIPVSGESGDISGGRPITFSFYDNLGQLYSVKLYVTQDINDDGAINSDDNATVQYNVRVGDVYDESGQSIFVKKTVDNSTGTVTYASTGATIRFGENDISAEDVSETTGEFKLSTVDPVKLKFNNATGEFAKVGNTDRTNAEVAGKCINFSVKKIDGTFEEANSSFPQYDPDTDKGGVEVDFSSLTQFSKGGDSTTTYMRGDLEGMGAGNRAGNMKGISISGSDGKIYGTYDNGEKKCLAQIAVTTFSNPSGLEAVGESMFAATLNSGTFDGVGESIAVTGSFKTGALEMSNVDLAAEFTQMITTQRGFQANSRIITTSDSMLEELVNLKR